MTRPVPVILLGTRAQYERLGERLCMQPFGLVEIGRELAGVHERLHTPPEPICCGRHRLSFGERTLVMGIINTTSDSFSGDGIDGSVEQALKQGRRFAMAGADIIDVGGQSTRPGSESVPLAEEIRRTVEPIRALSDELDLPVSIDTYQTRVAEAALLAGATFINDIYALRQDGMARLAADVGAGVCLMHMQGEPATMQEAPHYGDVSDGGLRFPRSSS